MDRSIEKLLETVFNPNQSIYLLLFQVMFGVPFGPEIDIWSLGCIFAELFLGKPLVIGDTREDILKQVNKFLFTQLINPFPQTDAF